MVKALESVLRTAAYTLACNRQVLSEDMAIGDVAQLVALVDAPAWRAQRDAWIALYRQHFAARSR